MAPKTISSKMMRKKTNSRWLFPSSCSSLPGPASAFLPSRSLPYLYFLQQKLEQFKYDGPVPSDLQTLRNEKSITFIRGLATTLIESGLNYMEKNRGKLN